MYLTCWIPFLLACVSCLLSFLNCLLLPGHLVSTANVYNYTT